jgi:hypothetical protein
VTTGGRSPTGAEKKELVGDFKNDGRLVEGLEPDLIRRSFFTFARLGASKP